MSVVKFRSLGLSVGDLIHLINEKGEGFSGTYEGEYDPSKETIKFSNFSTGQIETIFLERLQDLRK